MTYKFEVKSVDDEDLLFTRVTIENEDNIRHALRKALEKFYKFHKDLTVLSISLLDIY